MDTLTLATDRPLSRPPTAAGAGALAATRPVSLDGAGDGAPLSDLRPWDEAWCRQALDGAATGATPPANAWLLRSANGTWGVELLVQERHDAQALLARGSLAPVRWSGDPERDATPPAEWRLLDRRAGRTAWVRRAATLVQPLQRLSQAIDASGAWVLHKNGSLPPSSGTCSPVAVHRLIGCTLYTIEWISDDAEMGLNEFTRADPTGLWTDSRPLAELALESAMSDKRLSELGGALWRELTVDDALDAKLRVSAALVFDAFYLYQLKPRTEQ